MSDNIRILNLRKGDPMNAPIQKYDGKLVRVISRCTFCWDKGASAFRVNAIEDGADFGVYADELVPCEPSNRS